MIEVEEGKEFCSSYRRASKLECRADEAAKLNPHSATAVVDWFNGAVLIKDASLLPNLEPRLHSRGLDLATSLFLRAGAYPRAEELAQSTLEEMNDCNPYKERMLSMLHQAQNPSEPLV